jgi:hypothetical protein
MNVNTKSYNLVRILGKSFSLAINGFATALTFIFNNIFGLALTFVASLFMMSDSDINVKKVSLVFQNPNLTEKITQTINAKKVALLLSIRESLKAIVTITQGIDFLPGISSREKVDAGLSNKLPITSTVLLAQFNSLIVFDYLQLSDVDGEILGDMDYTLV